MTGLEQPAVRSRTLARNTLWNLLGSVLPAPVAVVAIPPLVARLGTERFGILTLGWVMMGYFSLCDLGLGRATTKFFADWWHEGKRERLPELFWTSFWLHAVLGLAGGSLLAFLVPWLVDRVFNIPPDLRSQARAGFFLLALSVPFVVVTTAARGVLEAVQRFDLVNLIKVPSSLFTYLGPLLVLPFSSHLAAVIGIIVLGRAVSMAAYLVFCWRLFPFLASPVRAQSAVTAALFALGGWLTVTSLITPLIGSIDRAIIGARVSMTGVAYYGAPYEVVTRLWLISGGLLGVLFPAFSVLAATRDARLGPLYSKATIYLFLTVVPFAGIVLAFSEELLRLWLGGDFARYGAPVARWLAVGMAVNMLAQVSFTLLQGTGRAALTAILQSVEMPLYAAGAWLLAGRLGIVGVAMAWCARAVVDAAALFESARRTVPAAFSGRILARIARNVLVGGLFLAGCALLARLPDRDLAVKAAIFFVGAIALLIWVWRSVLGAEERALLKSLPGAARRLSRD